MMKKTKQVILGLAVVIGLTASALPVATVGAADLDPCTLDASSNLCTTSTTDINDVFKTIVNVLLFIIGAVAIIMIIVSGIRYTTSGGNANSVAAAKNTLLYSVIGLVVAIFAYAIVNWVVGRIS